MDCNTPDLAHGYPREWFRDPAVVRAAAPRAAPGPQQDTPESTELRDRIVAYLDAHPTVGMTALARSLTGMGITISSLRIAQIWGDYHPGAARQYEEDQLAAIIARDEASPGRFATFLKELQAHLDYVAEHGEAPQRSPEDMSLINAHIRENRGVTHLPPLTEEERAAKWAEWEAECAGPLDPEREERIAEFNRQAIETWHLEEDRDEC